MTGKIGKRCKMDYTLRCTQEELKNGFGSKFWEDIKGTVEDAEKSGIAMVLNPELNEESVELNVIRGVVEGLRKVLELPEVLLDERKMQSEDTETEDEMEDESEHENES